jgi:serine/threonine-protein kinase
MLWILMTRKWLGFDGQYNSAVPTLALRTYCGDKEYLRPLETLIEQCTHPVPEARPVIDEVLLRLQEWCDARADFGRQNLLEWRHMQRLLFREPVPVRSYWENIDDIARVLNAAVSTEALNHCFLPDGGGNDFEGCEVRDGLLECDLGATYQVKPAALEVVIWPDYPEWSYFYVELSELSPTGVYGSKSFKRQEEFVRLPNGRLKKRSVWDEQGDYDSSGNFRSLPNESRLIVRFLSGNWAIVAKRSPYNDDADTYDGRHNTLGREGFFQYMRAHVYWERSGRKGVPDLGQSAFPPIGYRFK